ncbi:MAG: hypothetical protein R3F54_03050 [Alphaproteobacteria bacterium]
MDDRAPSQPKLTPRARADKEMRSDRLAVEMRKNLMKRKQQQRQKSASADGVAVDEGRDDDRT